MNAFIEATKWPMGFEPDDTTSLLQCTIVNERTSVEASVGQHVHQTGQFVVALSGLVGLALGRNRIAFPPSSAAWVPPGCRHEGFRRLALLPHQSGMGCDASGRALPSAALTDGDSDAQAFFDAAEALPDAQSRSTPRRRPF